MYKVKRTIYLGEESIDVWFGLRSNSRDKHSNFTVYILTDDPDNELNHAEPIKSGIPSKAEALKIGIEYAKDLFRNIKKNRKE